MSNGTIQPTGSEVELEDKVKPAFYAVAFVLGLLGNFLVIVIVAARRSRRTANDIFILNLAINDLVYLFVCLPTNVYMMFADIQYDLYCRLIWPLMTVTVNLSIFTLTSMAVFRCYVILNPFKAEMRHRYVLIWILGIWLLGLVLVLPLLLVTKPKLAEPSQGCTEVWPSPQYRQAYTASLFALQFMIPLTIIAVAYVRIGLDLVRQGRHQVPDHAVHQERRRENMQVIKTLATIVILFAICMLPAQLAWLLHDFAYEDNKSLIAFLFSFSPSLLYFHSCLNPIVYGTLTKHYRRGFIRFFSYVFCCGFMSLLGRNSAASHSGVNKICATWGHRNRNTDSSSIGEFCQRNNNTEVVLLHEELLKDDGTEKVSEGKLEEETVV
ncbi:neuropeptide FF receptor 1-like [Stylophora pistillata]|uniref:Neuropeptide FF receptor 1 n=1 Tax=Stylophora pistillata TaxID=50429 RepID=A0A2B4SSZ0_STYPI|nr:neuropeptide FF receptor 1-like [Stylophora pistillata]XP_022780680.1 neuropeptide FF receptor 1-like [Stylophora pistillata]XP_022780681.1 neuropeptide FF receptor 1-like [Stylophora pistillata]XP_022780682.1 neuropeptide FF receptor 1-like [Stylophora pistillata]XP_022780683.1 neuropeptide FF receptor 1-like [Stylophora pistillata]XP_022780684.1 neuropeptide FF receptor 1-like [Stylophora pistillata]XP_022780685.1 neuropeptide FF receptor 1-like [Stylophora pistillata]PFX31672.1 Neurope